MFFRRRRNTAETEPLAPGAQPGSTPDQPDVAREAERLSDELAALVRRANAAGGVLPPGAVPAIRETDDVLRPLLRYVRTRSASDEEMRHLSAIVRDYLPTALEDFLSLPVEYTERPGVTGTTPADDLVRQLQLLAEGAIDLQDAVYTGDAAQIAIQARFLDAKFRRSDLDL